MSRRQDTLYHRNKEAYQQMEDRAIVELHHLRKNHRVKDDIFSLLRSKADIHLIRFPIEDDHFHACTVSYNKHFFIFINTYQPLETQIFAAAHEFYHYLYDREFWTKGEILTNLDLDCSSSDENEMKANCFAACFLVPRHHVDDEIALLTINPTDIKLLDVVKLMDRFAVPYKTMVLRLHELGYVDERRTNTLLTLDDRTPKKDVQLVIERTGYAKRWQERTPTQVEYGGLLELVRRNTDTSVFTYRDVVRLLDNTGIDVDLVFADE